MDTCKINKKNNLDINKRESKRIRNRNRRAKENVWILFINWDVYKTFSFYRFKKKVK